MPKEVDEWHDRLGGFVGRPALDEYADKYSDHFVVERNGGVIELRMHSKGGPAVYSLGLHNAWGQAWQEIGNDPRNEVVILTGTGNAWLAGIDPASFAQPFHEWPGDIAHELYYDGMKLLENLVFGVDVPTIGVVNGPGFHTELALFCDITLAAEDAVFSDGHFAAGQAPGDGLQLAFQSLLGPKRAAHALYTSERIDARKALDLGLVNEVLPTDDLLPRARQIAQTMMDRPRSTRRLTHAIVQRPFRRRLLEDHGFGMAHELFGVFTDRPGNRG
ncbi:enoyl-CoA hydratase/isomerase family protein [Actinoallomurus sp. CA-142502]|uniref:enoyl-CoA hydratase/isomerase family protein n=1 Tax=Actinoallomurus sp. CA-142502 TaxID=3239885 RepID=UPI003D8CE47F